ncbi:MAG TPA: deoxyribonuclease IV, partial [Thermodesulfovibrionales bacterium]|nr:deoxyribonuclease IV [Thermodesulfovibrionales bacterium]
VGALREVARGRRWKAGLLIENTAGKRGDISSTLQAVSEIMNCVPRSLIAGVCIDTCHAFASGYDIRTAGGISRMAYELAEHIGTDSVKLIHLNDSKAGAGSRVDRHQHIGRGEIGADGLAMFVNHAPFRAVPLVLETPKKKDSDDQENIARVRKMIKAV